jgi:hypothetical protein
MNPLASSLFDRQPENLRQPGTFVGETQARRPIQDPESTPLSTDRVEIPLRQAPPASGLGTSRDARLEPQVPSSWAIRPLIFMGMVIAAFVLGWCGGFSSHWHLDPLGPRDATESVDISAVVEQIIKVESNGDPNAKNKRSRSLSR